MKQPSNISELVASFGLQGKITEKHAEEIKEILSMELKEFRYNLQQIAEIYIGMDGFIPQTAPEAYQQQKLKEIYEAIQTLLINIM